MGVSAHYLEIEWDAPGIAKRIEVSTYPIDLEIAPDGSLHAEVSIFRDFAPWFALRLSDDFGTVQPATIDAQGGRHAWLAVLDAHGSTWWIPATGWSKDAHRHLSEMHRSFGTFNVELGQHRRLIIDAVANELDRAHAQEYLDDFRDELVWLAIGRPTGAMGDVGADYNSDIIDALCDFADAAARVLEHPAREIREVTGSSSPSRLRPNAETFRALTRHPAARRFPGRVAEESWDIPENRYLRGMVQHCRRLARSIARSSSRYREHLAARSNREKTRAAELLATQRIEVDQEVFDNQLFDIQQRIDAIARWTSGQDQSASANREYRFTVGNRFGSRNGGKEFFYRNLDPEAQYRADDRYAYSVARLPDALHDLVLEAKSVDKDLSLTILGQATLSSFTQNGKNARRATFTHVTAVSPRSPVFERQIAARARYEREGWHRPISAKERQEFRAEANAALNRASQFDVRLRDGTFATEAVIGIGENLEQQDAAWSRSGVMPSSTFPMGMKFVQNPAYAATLAAFHRIKALEQSTGIGGDVLDHLGSINVLHASALYERWCLVKIIAVLIEDFGFVPQPDWVRHVVTFSAKASEPGDTGFRLRLERSLPAISAALDVEPVLANGRRPDFRLRFSVSSGPKNASIDFDHTQERAGLVMDAKFRTRWRQGELSAMLSELVDIKDYGQDGDRVFIVHPAKGAVAHPTSPLIWSRDCDYGQNHPTGHKRGSIQLGADLAAQGASTMNLRRLIALELQERFPEPQFEERSGGGDQLDGKAEACSSTTSLCIACGKAHEPKDVVQDWTKGGNPKWFYRCSECGAETMRTHCFGTGCGTELFKNGLQMTYHLTRADQITNIVCQNCGANF